MVRILISRLIAGLVLVGACSHAQEPGDRIDGIAGADVSLVGVNGYESWTDGSVGKLRFSENGLYVSRAFADMDMRLTDTLKASIVIEGYDDDLGPSVDLTEAFLQWRPVPKSPNRYGLKVGAFYPRLSLENVERGWTNPYLISSSAINTWIGEEVRLVGAEFSWSRKPVSLGGRHELSAQVAVFGGNDTSATLLSWKGWSIHDRQTRFSDELPLADLPALGPDGGFRRQDSHTEPVREIDGAQGFQVGVEWRYASRILVRALHYNNEADPVSFENGQYGWYTEFSHVGLQASLPGDVGLISQWLSGSTIMGPDFGLGNPIDVDFESSFILLTRPWGRHRVSVRYDRFDATDNDFVSNDDNSESGHGWTAGYRIRLSERMTVAAEYLRIRTRRPAFAYFDFDEAVTEEQAQLALQLRF